MLDNACQRFDRVGQWLDNGAGLVLCGAQKSPMKHQNSIMEVGTKISKPMQRVAVTICEGICCYIWGSCMSSDLPWQKF